MAQQAQIGDEGVRKEDFNHVCRSCLTPTQDSLLANIFELRYEQLQFSEIIYTLFGKEVKLDDELPKNMCELCITEIIGFYIFKQAYEASDRLLQTLSTQPVEEPIACKIEIVPNDDPEATSENAPSNSLNEVEVVFGDELEPNIFTLQIDAVETDPADLEKDSYVLETVKNSDELRIRKTRGPKYGQKVRAPRRFKPKIFTCSCEKTFALHSEFLKHLREENHTRAPEDRCQICHKVFGRKADVEAHMRTHTKEKPFACKFCSARFSLKGNMTRHMKRHTGEKPHVCEVCGKGFIQAPSLTLHKRTHTREKPEKPFLCTRCGKTFSNSMVYKHHMLRHGEDETNGNTHQRFPCKFCGKLFGTKSALNTHVIFHGEKKFLCSACGKTFYRKALLLSHSRVHTGEKPYSCKFCYRNFSQQGSLKSHLNTHTGDKPYVCKICFKRFSQNPHLKAHLRTHSGERPYKCLYCEKSFSLSGTLRVHVRTHTGETPYVCDICSKGFYDSNSLKRHRRRHSHDNKIKNEDK